MLIDLLQPEQADSHTPHSAKFAPNNSYGDNYTPSPRQTARDIVVNRTPSVSERIAGRLRALRPVQSSAREQPPEIVFSHDDSKEGDGDKTPQMDKGKGKVVESPVQTSPPPLSPPLPARKASIDPLPPRPPAPVLLAGIAFSPATLSALLKRAQDELPLRSVRLPIIGEYKDCFTGEEFVKWLRQSVEAFGDSDELAEEAAKDLTEDEGLLRRIGDLGNAFEPTEDAFYQIRPKVSASDHLFCCFCQHSNRLSRLRRIERRQASMGLLLRHKLDPLRTTS